MYSRPLPIFLRMFLPIAAIVLIGAYYFGKVEIEAEVGRLAASEVLNVELAAGAMSRSVSEIVLDLQFLANHSAVRAAIHAPTLDNIDHVAEDFSTFSRVKRAYDQIRWIDERGMEVVRVDYVEGKAVTIPRDRLQDKSNRYFFQDTIKLAPGEVFVSPLDLNVEHDKIQIPHKPMLRVGTPVTDSQGNKRGIVILNYYAQLMFDGVMAVSPRMTDQAMVLNREGYWLRSPIASDEWGFMLRRPDLSLAARAPMVWERIHTAETGQEVIADDLWTWKTIYPLRAGEKSSTGAVGPSEPSQHSVEATNYFWKSATRVPASRLSNVRRSVQWQLAAVAGLLLSVAGFGAWRLAVARARRDEAEIEIRHLNVRLEQAIEDRTNDLRVAIDEKRKLSLAVEQSPESIVITNLKAEIEYVNEAFVQKTGYSREEVIGKNPRVLNSGKTPPETFLAMWETLTKGLPWQGEFHNRRKDGTEYVEHAVITPIRQADGTITHYVAVKEDITVRKASEDQINTLAFYDPLTDLPNRRLLLDRLKQALAASARNKRHGALLFIDLDNFKTLNDTLGHDIGDLLLLQVAQRLSTCVREGDTVARLGGDEFVVMLEDLSGNAEESAAHAKTVGEKILTSLNQTYQLANYPHHSTPSIGVALFADQHETIDELLKRADLAMYQAKAAGRNTLRFFDPGMQAVVTKRAALEGDLRHAVLENQFFLHFQAQVVGEGRITGAEALLRWRHPQRGNVSPGEFIPLAEDTGLILPLGHWVLETACTQLKLWAQCPELAHLTIAVNVSARQFRHKDFVDQVLAVLEHTGANPRRLKLELTESLMVEDVESVVAKMKAIKSIGVGFSLDDFGTGYSSLAYLKRLPLDQLKIDQGFVRDILTDSDDAAIAKTIIALGESLSLTVIAEGVEIEAQRAFLEHHDCHAYQGYLFSRPLLLDDFQSLARKSYAEEQRLLRA